MNQSMNQSRTLTPPRELRISSKVSSLLVMVLYYLVTDIQIQGYGTQHKDNLFDSQLTAS
jgi:hypothetical protein